MRVPARNQRQVYTGYVNEQGHGDTEEAHPKPPIAVGASPIGTMNMRFMMVTVHDLIHSYPAFFKTMSLNELSLLFKVAHSQPAEANNGRELRKIASF